MNKKTSLLRFTVIPEIVNNKVIILTGSDTYIMMPIGKYCSLKDKPNGTQFNPRFFMLLETNEYCCIIDNKSFYKQDLLIDEVIRKYKMTNYHTCWRQV